MCAGDELSPVILGPGLLPSLPGGSDALQPWPEQRRYCQWVRWAGDCNVAGSEVEPKPLTWSVKDGRGKCLVPRGSTDDVELMVQGLK